MRLGAVISRLRTERNLTRAELADKAQIGVTTVYDLEKGTEDPRLITLSLICNALGVRLSELFAEAEKEES